MTRSLKYGLDKIAALLGLLALSPLFVIVSLLILLFNGRPVLFRQERIGLNERPFTLFKFRTFSWTTNLNATEKHVTRTGSFLRKSSLDEIPQLLNVLFGQMSLVGPRPLLPRYLPYYTPVERDRHLVKPGITGWAQIKGRNRVVWDDRLAMDVWYVHNWSFGLDLSILWSTFLAVVLRKGVVVRQDMVMDALDIERSKKLRDAN